MTLDAADNRRRELDRERAEKVARWLAERYGATWVGRARGLRLVGVDAFLAWTPGWDLSPVQQRHRAVPKVGRGQVGEELGQRLRRRVRALTDGGAAGGSPLSVSLSLPLGAVAEDHDPSLRLLCPDAHAHAHPAAGPLAVVCIEKPYLRGFVAGFGGEDAAALPPFVLLLINGGDEPVTVAMTECLSALPTLSACFATNLHRPADPKLFRPLPIGMAQGPAGRRDGGERAAAAARAAAKPWAARDRRLLVAPMAQQGRLRAAYVAVMSEAKYRGLVNVVATDRRLPHDEFLALVARHRCVLSPPGRGYDCFRTWEALAVGTVPLVVPDGRFDPRLFERTGAAFIPRPEDLTPEVLAAILAGLEDPAPHAGCLEVQTWLWKWRECLGT